MGDSPHRVRQEALHVHVDSESLALELRPRLEGLNRHVFLPLLERVFDEFDMSGTHIGITRLELDLGTLTAADLESLAATRLEQALREQLRRHLHGRGPDSPIVVARSAEASRFAAVEDYLLTGVLPFWAPAGLFDLDHALTDLLESDPAAVARLIRRHAANDRLLRRLAVRLDDTTLRRLLQVLAPDDAAVILIYLSEIRDYHAVEPIIPASADHVGRLLWLVTLTYVVRDPGTQFNRRSFVESLFRGVAAAERLTYEDVLSLFDAGLVRMAGPGPLPSTLLTVVTELVAEEQRVNPWFVGSPARRETMGAHGTPSPAWLARYQRLDALRYFARHGLLPWTTLLEDLSLTYQAVLDGLPDLSLSAWQSLTGDLPEDERVRAWERLVEAMPDETLARLLVSIAVHTGDVRSGDGAALCAAATAAERTSFYARLIPALLEGRPAHEEPWRQAWRDRGLPAMDLPRDPQWIRSVLTQRAVSGGEAVPDAPPSPVLLTMLISGSADETKRWLAALQSAGLPAARVLHESPDTGTLEAARTLLAPEAATAMTVLLEALALPGPERPGSADWINTILLEETLTQRPSQSAADLMARILRRLYGTRSSRPMLDLMAAAAGRLVYAGRMTTSARDAFTGMLQGLDARPAPSAGETGADAHAREAEAETAAAAAIAWLRDLGPDSGAGGGRTRSDDTLRQMLRRALNEAPEEMRAFLGTQVTDVRARRRWAAVLSEADLVRVLALLDSGSHRVLLDSAERLFSAWVLQPSVRGADSARRSTLWLFLLEFLAGTAPSERSHERMVRAFFTYVGRRTASAGAVDEPAPLADRLIDTAVRLAGAAGDAPLRAVLVRDRPDLRRVLSARVDGTAPVEGVPKDASAPPFIGSRSAAELPPVSRPPTPQRGRMAFSLGDSEAPGEGDPIYVTNAGLVLAAPFLPRLFQSLDMLETGPDGRMRIRPAQISRAVHLLQWAVDGRRSAPEPLLCLNKLLCGVALATPVDHGIDPTAFETDTATALLRAIIGNWTIVSNTSIAGLQETFLQRDGRLERTSNGWRLQVQRKTVDVLLDHLPWGLSTIIHSLMPEPIFVKW